MNEKEGQSPLEGGKDDGQGDYGKYFRSWV